MKHFLLQILSIITLSASVLGYSSCSSSSQESYMDDGYDGTYYWSGFQSSHTVTICGDTWSGTSIMYDEVEYEHGQVRGNKIYDPSDYFVIARISGNSIRWNNHTLRKE